MGEIQGNLWASLVFIVIFGATMWLVLYAIGLMGYSSQVKVIEDSLSSGNTEYIEKLPAKFTPCGPNPVETTENCTGIVITRDENGDVVSYEDRITYQVSYNGLVYNQDASVSEDFIVMLPY